MNHKNERTFTELCQFCGMSAPWVKKVQAMFKLRELSLRGKKGRYDEDYCNKVKLISMLREVGLEFQEVQDYFNHDMSTKYVIEKIQSRFKVLRDLMVVITDSEVQS